MSTPDQTLAVRIQLMCALRNAGMRLWTCADPFAGCEVAVAFLSPERACLSPVGFLPEDDEQPLSLCMPPCRAVAVIKETALSFAVAERDATEEEAQVLWAALVVAADL